MLGGDELVHPKMTSSPSNGKFLEYIFITAHKKDTKRLNHIPEYSVVFMVHQPISIEEYRTRFKIDKTREHV